MRKGICMNLSDVRIARIETTRLIVRWNQKECTHQTIGSAQMENRKRVKNMDEYEKRDKETAELVYRITEWIRENVDLTDDEYCMVEKIGQKAFEKY